MDNDITRVVGMDVSDRYSHLCVLGLDGEVEEESKVPTTPHGIRRRFSEMDRVRVALEVGTHSPWMGRLLEELGHEVILANPRKVRSIYQNNHKSDRVDAEMLARLARSDPKLLCPVQVRSEDRHAGLVVIRSRRILVETRTKLINHVRGVCKSLGVRLPKCTATSFHRGAVSFIPEEMLSSLEPVLRQLDGIEGGIRDCDLRIKEMASEIEGVEILTSASGVGNLTAVTYVLTLGDPSRFRRSREVGSYVGLRPKRDQSGEVDKQLRVTRAGDKYLRSLLVGSAQYILGPFGPDSALRDWGLGLAERGGKAAKKRAVVAVARKLSVILHRMWVTGEMYQAFPEGKPEEKAA
ncbi:MAG: IS110 family transposase [bacterium]